jgi:hypothetical protein
MLALGAIGCGDNIKVTNNTPDARITQPDQQMVLSTAKALTAFSFEKSHNAALPNDIAATINGTTISATVPNGTTVTALVPTFTTTGASVKVGTAVQTSGTTPNDFTSDVMYTVTAEDGSTQVYTVTVTVAASNAKSITAFTFEATGANVTAGITPDPVDGDINGTSITATVPNGTNVTALVATFTTTGVSVKVGSVVQVSGTTANNFSATVNYIVTAADNSTQTYTVMVTIAASSAKDLTDFRFLTVNNPTAPVLTANATGVYSGTQITVIVPFGTDRNGLKASFGTTGASVKVGTVDQMSDVTGNDFSTPVDYVVTAADGSTQTYTVTVDNSQASDKDIQSFELAGFPGTISGTDINVTVPNGTIVTALAATEITITGASVSPGVGAVRNFTTPVTYTVTAADLTTKDYHVIVTVAGASDKDIIHFSINGLEALITNVNSTTGVITINMPNGTDLTSLTPDITINGVKVSPASGVPQNFTNPVLYTVTAADNSTKIYTVNVGVVNGNGTKLITSFKIGNVSGSISNGASSSTITLTLPAGTDLSSQTPFIVINGSSLNPPSGVPQDFRNPVTYTVTAADGSTRVYTVTVTLAP